MTTRFFQLKQLLTTLLLVAAMAMPTMVWAAITPSKPTGGDGSSSNPYQISTAAQLYWFAGLVNGTLTDGTAKNAAACAKLTANITVNSNVLKSDGTINSSKQSSFTAWTPIGYYNSASDNVLYTGTFDGNGKTISGLYFNNTGICFIGLFGYNGGTVKNVGIVDSYFKGYQDVGGVCGQNYEGIIFNCYYQGTIVGDDIAGGICGYNSLSTIVNCYCSGSVSVTGSNANFVGGVCGFSIYAVIENCYYNMDKCSEDVNGYYNFAESRSTMGKTTSQFQSGEVAYLLSEGRIIKDTTMTNIYDEKYILKGGVYDGSEWGQTLGTDNYPVLGGKEVFYGSVNCLTDEEGYSNSSTPHNYNNGFCTLCGDYQPAEYVDENHHPELLPEYRGYYAIENAGQLYWFANRVNKERYNGIDAVLTDHITVNSGVIDNNGELASNTSGFRKWTPIGWWTETGSVKYNGIIDGNNHQITGLYFNDENADNVGLLGYTVGTVRNLGIIGSYFKGGNNVGSMYGYGSGRIINCFFYNGQVHGNTYVGGLCGHSYGTTTLMCNSYMAAKVSGTTNAGSMCGYSAQENTIANCYYDKEKCSIGGICGSDVAGKAEGKTLAEFQSGKITYLLSQGCIVNGEEYSGTGWVQTIGFLDYPYFIGKIVYAGYDKCDENAEKIYSNSLLPTSTLSHSIGKNGFCTACTTGYQPAELVSNTNHADLLETHNGYYAIENAGQLYWLAKQVNSGNIGIKAVVTNDITVNDGNVLYLGDWRDWTPIGNESNAYSGKFDGQEYTLSGLYLVETEESHLGLFGYIGNDGSVSNVNVSNVHLEGYKYVGAICGYLSQGTITNCNASIGKIDSWTHYAGGICGYVKSGTISNCFNSCFLDAKYQSVGGICGYNKGTIDNCRNSADINIDEPYYVGGVCGYNEGTIKNSFNNSVRIASSGQYVGGVCGLNTFYIINCKNKASVSADQGYVGGVCGKSLYGQIIDCYNDGEVYIMKVEETSEEYDYIGGVCGYAEDTRFENCYNLRGIKTPWDYAGGICGYLGDKGNIQDCHNEGSVSASSYVGGVCGYGTFTGNITNCYNTGSITGSGSYVGGIGGKFVGYITTMVCYNTGSISGGWDYVGGISGFSISDTRNCYNKGDVKGSNNNTGGLLGSNSDNVINCYNTGRVEGKSIVGGLVGYNYQEEGEHIFNCFQTGEVIGTGDNIGELCGENNSSGTITRCFLITDQSTGNIIGNSGGTYTNILTLSIDAFNSGEVAYLLAQETDGSVWGQQLGVDNYPVPGSSYKVIRAAQDGQESTTYWATFSNLDNDATLSVPADRTLKVYDATVSGGALTLTERNDCQVAKGEGILLKTDGEYVNAKANETDVLAKADYTDNNLVATPSEAETITADEGYTLYRLTYNNVENKEGLGFYLGVVGSVKDGSQLKATPCKAYLKVASSETANARGFAFMEDEDDATGIKCVTVTDEASQGNSGNSDAGNSDDSMYDLGGRKVSQPAKGLYIRNGKKVIIK